MSTSQPTLADVDAIYTQRALTDAEAQRLIDMAGRLAREYEVDGDYTDFATLLAAHIWTLAEGGEVGSESQTGGSVSYVVNASGSESGGGSLRDTRYGRMAANYIEGDGASTGVWSIRSS